MGTDRSQIGRDATARSSRLLGRELELRRLAVLVDGIEESGGALVVRGEAGIGTSALLAAAAESARVQGLVVFQSTGVESETRLPFAGLHALLRPFIGALDSLPSAQRVALEMALGLTPRDAAPDMFLIGLAALGLVTETATEASLLSLSHADDLIGGLWVVIATAFVFRTTEHESVTAAKTRVAATALGFALCFVYLLFLPFHAWGLAALIAVCTLLLTSLGQSGDVGVAAITIGAVMVIAALGPHHA